MTTSQFIPSGIRPLLSTKLHVASAKAALMERPRLLEKMDAGTSVVVVSAPSGYGKTSLVLDWRLRSGDSGPALGWLSLDDADNDPSRMWVYLDAAVDSALGAETEYQNGSRSIEDFRVQLINRLASASKPVVVVLDDVHLIRSRGSSEAIEFLATNLPTTASLILLSRSSPPTCINRLVGQGLASVLTAEDLCFTHAETAEFLATSGLALDISQVEVLHARTEGWPAGLLMAVHAISKSGNVAQAIEVFSGRDHHVGQYFRHEVLDGLDPDLREFLVATSVLNRLTGSLCDDLLGVSESTAILKHLHQQNLFVVALDDRGEWFRYHHLFVDLLRHELVASGQDSSVLQHRASGWFERNDLPEEAVVHALSSGDDDLAARLMSRYVERFERSGGSVMLRQWFDGLPVEARSRPETAVGLVWNLMASGSYRAGLDSIDRLQNRDSLTPAVVTECLLATAFGERQLFHHDESLQAATKALASLDEFPQKADVHAARKLVAVNQLLDVHLFRGDTATARMLLEDVAVHAETSRHKVCVPRTRGLAAVIEVEAGEIYVAERRAAASLEVAAKFDLEDRLSIAEACLALGGVAWERGESDAALDHLNRAIVLCRTGNQTGLVLALLARATIGAASGMSEQARGDIEEVEGIPHAAGDLFLRSRLATAMVTILLRQRRLEDLPRWLDDLHRAPVTMTSARLAIVRALIALRRMTDASAILASTVTVEPRAVVASTLLDARIRLARHDTDGAIDLTRSATALAESVGLWQSLLDDMGPLTDLLIGLRGPASQASPGYLERLRVAAEANPEGLIWADATAEMFSPRELEVVDLLATRLSTDQLAQRLYISTNTMKTHLRNIYRKLGAHSRDEALELLDSLRAAGP